MTMEFSRRTGLAWATTLLLGGTPPVTSAKENEPVIHQLRIYEIFEHTKQAFHERFRAHAMRIMAKYDFEIIAIWEAQRDGRTEFVYLLQWPDRATLTDRWARFMADPEWAEIKKRTAAQYGNLVGEIQDRVLSTADYSPTKEFQVPVQL